MHPVDETIRQQASDVAQQARRIAALVFASNPPTPIHVVAESVETLSHDVAELQTRLRQEPQP